jgi:hypothetical protein
VSLALPLVGSQCFATPSAGPCALLLRFYPDSSLTSPPPTSPLSPTGSYKLDSTFVHLPPSEVLEHIQASLAKYRTEVEELEKEKDECEAEMEGLKKELYAKFGSTSSFSSLSSSSLPRRPNEPAKRLGTALSHLFSSFR